MNNSELELLVKLIYKFISIYEYFSMTEMKTLYPQEVINKAMKEHDSEPRTQSTVLNAIRLNKCLLEELIKYEQERK